MTLGRHKATYAPSVGCVSTCMCYEIDCYTCAHVQLHTKKSPLRSLLSFPYNLPCYILFYDVTCTATSRSAQHSAVRLLVWFRARPKPAPSSIFDIVSVDVISPIIPTECARRPCAASANGFREASDGHASHGVIPLGVSFPCSISEFFILLMGRVPFFISPPISAASPFLSFSSSPPLHLVKIQYRASYRSPVTFRILM